MKIIALVVFSFMLPVGCATTVANNKVAEKTFYEIEQRLLSAKVLRIEYEVVATGAIEAKLSGDLVMQQPGLAAIQASGVFNKAPAEVRLVANEESMRGGSTTQSFNNEIPTDLRNGLLLGLTRMGILHNLAMLVSGAPPQGTDGSIEQWARAKSFSWQSRSDRVTTNSLAFDIEVGGAAAGEVVLRYDSKNGLPVERRQIVHFPTGDMLVVERYDIELEGMIGPCRFAH